MEQAIKASYLTKFGPFVEWPANSFGDAGTFAICLGGHDAFGTVLDEIARGQKVWGHVLQIRRLTEAGSPNGCNILVIGAGTPDSVLARIAGQPILTVTDKSDGIDGGMIRFTRQGGRVRFEIDNGAARAARLVISSKLLGLAVTVTK